MVKRRMEDELHLLQCAVSLFECYHNVKILKQVLEKCILNFNEFLLVPMAKRIGTLSFELFPHFCIRFHGLISKYKNYNGKEIAMENKDIVKEQLKKKPLNL